MYARFRSTRGNNHQINVEYIFGFKNPFILYIFFVNIPFKKLDSVKLEQSVRGNDYLQNVYKSANQTVKRKYNACTKF